MLIGSGPELVRAHARSHTLAHAHAHTLDPKQAFSSSPMSFTSPMSFLCEPRKAAISRNLRPLPPPPHSVCLLLGEDLQDLHLWDFFCCCFIFKGKQETAHSLENVDF